MKEITYAGRDIVIHPEGLVSTDFNSFSDLARLSDAFSVPTEVLMTQDAKEKYEKMLFSEDELEKISGSFGME